MTAVGQIGGPGPGSPVPAGGPPAREQVSSSKATTFQIIAQLALPIALTAIAFFQPRSWWFWGLVALAFVPVLPRIYRPARRRLRSFWAQFQDNRRARQAYPEFNRFVSQFSEFVDTSSSNKLGDIIERELRPDNIATVKGLGMTPERVFYGFWEQLHERTSSLKPNRKTVTILVREFNHLLHQYLKETVKLAFDRMPPDVRSSLPEKPKSELEAFRERLRRYLNDYNTFATKLAESLETTGLTEPRLSPPKPHT